MSVYIGQRDVVSVSGEEATSFLQGQISQDVGGLGEGVGASAWSLILKPQGNVDAWFRVTSTGEENSYLLDVDAGYGEALLARLNRFKLRTKADLVLESWDWHAYWNMEEPVPRVGGSFVVRPAGSRTHDVIGRSLSEPDDDDVLSNDEFEKRRILDMVPAMGAELTEDTIPAEAGVVDGSVSFTKGCYTGQELVARVDSRGNNTPRRLARISGSGTASVGDEPTIGDAVVARLTSVVNHSDGFIALGYVKRSAFEATSAILTDRTVTIDLPA